LLLKSYVACGEINAMLNMETFFVSECVDVIVCNLPVCDHLFLRDSISDHHCYWISSSEHGTFHSII